MSHSGPLELYSWLNFAALEQVVLVAAAAVGALQAADKQHRYPGRDDHGKDSTSSEPLNKMMHIRYPDRGNWAPSIYGETELSTHIITWTRANLRKLI
jgi:hypothetical protein